MTTHPFRGGAPRGAGAGIPTKKTRDFFDVPLLFGKRNMAAETSLDQVGLSFSSTGKKNNNKKKTTPRCTSQNISFAMAKMLSPAHSPNLRRDGRLPLLRRFGWRGIPFFPQALRPSNPGPRKTRGTTSTRLNHPQLKTTRNMSRRSSHRQEGARAGGRGWGVLQDSEGAGAALAHRQPWHFLKMRR